jgi:hypothetical protein
VIQVEPWPTPHFPHVSSMIPEFCSTQTDEGNGRVRRGARSKNGEPIQSTLILSCVDPSSVLLPVFTESSAVRFRAYLGPFPNDSRFFEPLFAPLDFQPPSFPAQRVICVNLCASVDKTVVFPACSAKNSTSNFFPHRQRDT